MASVWGELKRRNVVRVAVAYVIVGWLILQFADVLVPLLTLPEWVGRLNFLLLLVGFPLALFFAWAYELTPEGLKKEKDVDRSESITHITGRKLDFVIIGVLGVAVGYLLVDKIYLSEGDTAPDEIIATERKSIAVLPFVNMSDDANNEYFSDGISEELLNLLAQIPQLRVISRSSAFSFKGKDIVISSVAEQLNVTHVLEGSVRKAGNRIRITAQLIEARSDTHLWSQTYDRELDDIFAIQDEIARIVVDELKIKLLGDLPKTRATDPEAYSLYLQSRQLAQSGSVEALTQAESLLKRALTLDPDYVPALNELGKLYYVQTGRVLSAEEGRRRSIEMNDRALAIDPNDGTAVAYLAWNRMEFDEDFAAAARLLQRAIDSEPENEDVHRVGMIFSQVIGRPDAAVALGEYGIARNPLSRDTYYYLARSYLVAGAPDQAEATFRRLVLMFAGGGQYSRGIMQLLSGNADDALTLFDEFVDREDVRGGENQELAYHGRALALRDLGRTAEFDAAFNVLVERWGEERPTLVAQLYAWTGDAASAIEWLNKAIASGTVRNVGSNLRHGKAGIALQVHFPLYSRLHGDPRWQAFLEKNGVAPEQLAAIEFKVTLPE